MQEFVFVYRLPQDYRIGDADTGGAWKAWFAGMGDSLLDLGKPVGNVAPVGNCAPELRLAGYSRISAPDRESAEDIAGRCPALASGGGVDVGTLIEPSFIRTAGTD
jgi:hypothetical protein